LQKEVSHESVKSR